MLIQESYPLEHKKKISLKNAWQELNIYLSLLDLPLEAQVNLNQKATSIPEAFKVLRITPKEQKEIRQNKLKLINAWLKIK